MEKKYKGIIPPLVTPLLCETELDVEGLERLIERLIAGCVHALFILGTTGEAQSFSMDMRMQMIKKSSEILKKRLPLLVGISDTSLVDSTRLTDYAYENGADAVITNELGKAMDAGYMNEVFMGMILTVSVTIALQLLVLHPKTIDMKEI